jgi:hypothetical protein
MELQNVYFPPSDKTKYLYYYRKFEKEGINSDSHMDGRAGLCYFLSSDEDFLLFKPTEENLIEFKDEINVHHYEGGSPKFWASGDKEERRGEFTDLRKTIMLLLAAMNGELND